MKRCALIPLLIAMTVFLGACSGPAPEPPSTPATGGMKNMDVAFETAEGFFFTGNGQATSPFTAQSGCMVTLELGLDPATSFSKPAARAAKAHYGNSFKGTAEFTPQPGSQGILSFGDTGRFTLRGPVSADGRKFSGTWDFDNQAGGTFVIGPSGSIFP